MNGFSRVVEPLSEEAKRKKHMDDIKERIVDCVLFVVVLPIAIPIGFIAYLGNKIMMDDDEYNY